MNLPINNPLVSIVIPVYNGANYLAKAIDCALAQTWPEVEILVVNDGSNDGGETETIALSYGDKIRYFAKENGGVSSTLNLGVAQMRGDYFSWLSHDDLYTPDKIACQMEALRQRGDMRAVVFSDFEYLDAASGARTPAGLRDRFVSGQLESSVFPVVNNVAYACTFLVHRSHFDRVGLFTMDWKASQDGEFAFRLFRGQHTVFVPRVLVQERIHPAQNRWSMNCYKQEFYDLFRHFMEELPIGEVREMYPHPARFYFDLSVYFKAWGAPEQYYDTAHRRLCETYDYRDEDAALAGLQSGISALSGGVAQRLLIYGAGGNGRELYYKLKGRRVRVDGFIDSNPELKGSQIDGVPCISAEDAAKNRENSLVVAAAMSAETILQQLEEMDFPYTVPMHTIWALLKDAPPVTDRL